MTEIDLKARKAAPEAMPVSRISVFKMPKSTPEFRTPTIANFENSNNEGTRPATRLATSSREREEHGDDDGNSAQRDLNRDAEIDDDRDCQRAGQKSDDQREYDVARQCAVAVRAADLP